MDAAAAVEKYGAPCIVIDFGTATTFNAVAAAPGPGAAPVYLGGAICLGISVSLQALFARAAKIPSIEIARPDRAIGSNTNAALQSGIVFGYVAQVAGIVARFREEMGAPDCPVIATGGHAAHIIAEESAVITAVEDHLTLEGLRLVYERHHGEDSPPAPDDGGDAE
jgi:type III pantothenate kinase